MRKLISINHVSLDGVVQAGGGPHEDAHGGFPHGGWQVPFRSPEGGKAVLEIMSGAFDLLLGRRTYEIWAAFWPYAGDFPVAQAINQATKYVVTNSLDTFDWVNTQGLSGDAVDAVRRLKAAGGPDLHIWGSRALLQALIAAELVDEFRMWVYPVVLGSGKRLFEAGVPAFGLTLVESRGTPRGVLMNTYRPAGPLQVGPFPADTPSEAEIARRARWAVEDAV